MVRAAASGVIDYTRADPNDIQWKLRHRLLLHELERQENFTLLDSVHRHWLSHVAHGSLTEESFRDVKKNANEVMESLRDVIFPWATTKPKTEGATDTISAESRDLVERYKAYQKARNAEKE